VNSASTRTASPPYAKGASLPDLPLLRSYLYAPGSSERILAKVLDAGADAVILDLEDSVAPANKDTARAAVADFLCENADRPGRPELHVRVNGGHHGFDIDDVRAVVGSGLSAIRLPKCHDPRSVRLLHEVLSNLEAERKLPRNSIRVYALIESAAGLYAAGHLAAAPRMARLCFGSADFLADIGARGSAHGPATLYARSRLVMVSRVASIGAPVDSVHTNLDDPAGLREGAILARDMGFSGKSVIHPNQLADVHDVFTPTEDEIAWAKKVVAAFDAAQERGEAALALEGEFIDPAVVGRARGLLAIAEENDRGGR